MRLLFVFVFLLGLVSCGDNVTSNASANSENSSKQNQFENSESNDLGEISVSELIKVSKMDAEAFEIYSMKRGYNLKKFDLDDDGKVTIMQKSGGKLSKKYLQHLSSKSRLTKYSSLYESWNENELLNIYEDLNRLGFNFYKNEELENHYIKKYKRNWNEIFSVHITKNETNRFLCLYIVLM